MRRIVSILVTFIAVIAVSAEASAQHTAVGQGLVSLHLEYPFSNSFDVRASYGKYVGIGYWDAGVSVADRRCRASESGSIYSFTHANAYGEFMFRCVSDRSRRFNLYAGAGIFLGAEITDPFGMLKNGEYAVTKKGTQAAKLNFLYGLYPRIELEIFLVDRFAVVIDGAMPSNFSSQFKNVLWEAGIGFRYNFN